MKDFLKRIANGGLLKYIGIGYISTVLSMLINLLLIRYLNPMLLGKVTLGKSVFQSFEFSHIGIRYGLDRLLPHCTDEEERNLIFSIGYFFSFVFSLFFVLFWIFYYPSDVLFYACFYVSGLIYTLVTVYRIYYRSLEQKKDFVNLSFFIIVCPLLIQLFGLVLAGINGFIIAHLVSYVFSFGICYYFWRIRISLFKKDVYIVLKKLLSSGFILFLSTMVNFFATTGDRFMIAEYWGLETLGIYSVVMFFFSAYTILSLNYTELIMSKIILNPTSAFVIKHILFVVMISLILILISLPFIPFFVNLFMPQYNNYIFCMELILCSVIPFAVLPILNYSLHALDRRNILLGINIICTSLYFIALKFILSNSNTIESLIYLKIVFNTFIAILTFSSFMYFKRESL